MGTTNIINLRLRITPSQALSQFERYGDTLFKPAPRLRVASRSGLIALLGQPYNAPIRTDNQVQVPVKCTLFTVSAQVVAAHRSHTALSYQSRKVNRTILVKNESQAFIRAILINWVNHAIQNQVEIALQADALLGGRFRIPCRILLKRKTSGDFARIMWREF